MKLFYFIFIILSLSSCTLISEHIISSQKNKYIKPTKSKKPKRNPFEVQLIRTAQKEVASKPLTLKTVKQLQKILKKKENIIFKEKIKTILGHHFFQKKSYKRALFYYSQVKYHPLNKFLLLREAKIYSHMNKNKEALKRVHLLLEEDLSPELSIETYLLKEALILRGKIS